MNWKLGIPLGPRCLCGWPIGVHGEMALNLFRGVVKANASIRRGAPPFISVRASCFGREFVLRFLLGKLR